MILVTLGTQDKSFKRLLKAIDKEIENKNIKEKVIVQAGQTKYKSKNMEIFDFIPEEELNKLVKDCRILITHGGVGSILLGIKNNKPVIAAARLQEYKEHTNNHQVQIIKEFVERGYILELNDFSKLSEKLSQVKSFKRKEFTSNTTNFIKNIEDYIDKDNHISWFNKYRILVSNGYRGIFLSIINIIITLLLHSKFSIFANIMLSFFITLILGLFLNLLINVKYNKKVYILNNLFIIIMELLLMFLFMNVINFNLLFSKIMSLVVILIIDRLIINNCITKNQIVKLL